MKLSCLAVETLLTILKHFTSQLFFKSLDSFIQNKLTMNTTSYYAFLFLIILSVTQKFTLIQY